MKRANKVIDDMIASRSRRLYTGRGSDVTIICGHITISVLWGNTEYCVKLSGEDLLRYSNKIESVGLRKCPYYHYLTKKVMLQIYNNKHFAVAPHHGG